MYAEKHCSQGFKSLLLDGPCEDVLVQDAFKASCSSDVSTNVQASAMGIESGRSSPARTARDFKAKQLCT